MDTTTERPIEGAPSSGLATVDRADLKTFIALARWRLANWIDDLAHPDGAVVDRDHVESLVERYAAEGSAQ